MGKNNKLTRRPPRRGGKSGNNAKGTLHYQQLFRPMPKLEQPVPLSRWVKMKTACSFTLDLNNTTFGTAFEFKINSIYNPFGTHATSQPYWYDQFGGLYRSYLVTGGLLRLSATPVAKTGDPTQTLPSMVIGVVVTESTEAFLSVDQVIEYPGSKHARLLWDNSPYGGKGEYTSAMHPADYMLTRRFDVLSEIAGDIDVTSCGAAWAADPTRILYVQGFIGYNAAIGGTGSITIEVVGELEQDVIVYDRDTVASTFSSRVKDSGIVILPQDPQVEEKSVTTNGSSLRLPTSRARLYPSKGQTLKSGQ